ncbi:MAG: methylmalonyl-CoA epimerase [Candidatus Promineifilaceae bacterium]
MIKKIHHVAVVLPDMEAGRLFWEEVLGLTLSHTARVEEQAVDVAFLPVGESEIELLRPFTDDSGVAKYLAKKGPGLHHICLEVLDIDAMLTRLQNAGIQLIDNTPRLAKDGTKYAFVHPKATGGVLVELYETVADMPA